MFCRASVESYLSSLSLLITERRRGWWTDLQTDQRILLSSLHELIFLLFEITVLSCSQSYRLPSILSPWERGAQTQRRDHLWAWSCCCSLELWWGDGGVCSKQPDIPVWLLALQLLHQQGSGCLWLLPETQALPQRAEKCRILWCQVRHGAATARSSTGTTRLQPGSVSDRVCAQAAPGVPPICRGPGNASESSSATLLLWPFPNDPPPLFFLWVTLGYLMVVLTLNTFPHKHHSHNYFP